MATKGGGRITLVLVGASAAAVAFASWLSAEDVSDSIAQRLLGILPREERDTIDDIDNGTAVRTQSHHVGLSKESRFRNGGHYVAKEAMEERYAALRERCKVYGDFMRPERHMVTHATTAAESVLYDARNDLALCTVPGVARRGFGALFDRIRGASRAEDAKRANFEARFPATMRDVKRAIMVRHPLERLVSAYRHNFEARLNPTENAEEPAKMTFADFVSLVLDGPIEYADFLEENDLQGSSVAVDTGSIDGEGVSAAWNPVWRQCSACHPHLQPQYILHMDHFREDSQVLIELLGGGDSAALNWLDAAATAEAVSGERGVEEHYWSQLTRDEVRRLHDKYRIDHELFGFEPDYYVAMGREGEGGDGEQEDTM